MNIHTQLAQALLVRAQDRAVPAGKTLVKNPAHRSIQIANLLTAAMALAIGRVYHDKTAA